MIDDSAAKLDRLLTMTGRLITALTLDVDALSQGRARELKMIEPEMQRLASLYEREAGSFSQHQLQAAPPDLRNRYLASVKVLHNLLRQQQRLLTRMRRVSEGMVRAVADELARRQALARPYTRLPEDRPRSAGAMVYNQTA